MNYIISSLEKTRGNQELERISGMKAITLRDLDCVCGGFEHGVEIVIEGTNIYQLADN